MKIAYLTFSTIPSPAAHSIHIMKMCESFTQNGHKLSLYIPSLSNKSSEDIFTRYNIKNPFRIYRIPVFPIPGKRLLFSIFGLFLLIVHKPDLVYSRFSFTSLASSLFGFRTIFESHAPAWLGTKIENSVFSLLCRQKKITRMVVISESLKQAYINDNRFPMNKIFIAPDAADFQSPNLAPFPFQFRKNALQVGYVGSLFRGKGIEIIVKIAKSMPNVDFHIIGGQQAEVDKWLSENITANLLFHGFVTYNKISSYIRHFDICLLPNQKDVYTFGNSSQNIGAFTSPLKMFDYMAHAKPIIASDLPVLREILNNSNAVLVAPTDISGWCQAVDLLRDKTTRERLGRSAFNEFLNKYTWKIRARNVINEIF